MHGDPHLPAQTGSGIFRQDNFAGIGEKAQASCPYHSVTNIVQAAIAFGLSDPTKMNSDPHLHRILVPFLEMEMPLGFNRKLKSLFRFIKGSEETIASLDHGNTAVPSRKGRGS